MSPLFEFAEAYERPSRVGDPLKPGMQTSVAR
jgi:hypothetical protein